MVCITSIRDVFDISDKARLILLSLIQVETNTQRNATKLPSILRLLRYSCEAAVVVTIIINEESETGSDAFYHCHYRRNLAWSLWELSGQQWPERSLSCASITSHRISSGWQPFQT